MSPLTLFLLPWSHKLYFSSYNLNIIPRKKIVICKCNSSATELPLVLDSTELQLSVEQYLFLAQISYVKMRSHFLLHFLKLSFSLMEKRQTLQTNCYGRNYKNFSFVIVSLRARSMTILPLKLQSFQGLSDPKGIYQISLWFIIGGIRIGTQSKQITG